MSILREELITNHLLLDYFEMWEEFDISKVEDPNTIRYYDLIMNLIEGQLDASIQWLESDEGKAYFFGETEYQHEVFQALEDEWDEILSGKYPSVDALLDEVYRKGKSKGYADMRERIRYSEADTHAIRLARDYNYQLIRRIDDDTRNQIKNKITEAVIAGEHPYTVAPKILKIADEKLEGSNFTPRQRATMIARTEMSRVKNTGVLQSYVNEGYTEVKILTAGDDNVCTTCLEYAFKFDEADDITYETRGKERVHNIIELIKGGKFPPFHPLCRCTYLSVWSSKGEPPEDPYVVDLTPTPISTEPVPPTELPVDELNKLNFKELSEYVGADYKGLETYDYDGKKYHVFEQSFDNGRTLTLRFEEGAVKSYTKKGIAHPNEIINEVFKVPEVLRRETNEIWFKNNNSGIQHKYTKSGYDSLAVNVGGYNTQKKLAYKGQMAGGVLIDDFDHRIVINPKYFKGGGKGRYSYLWRQDPDKITNWKKTIDHEFWHSGCANKKIWDNYDGTRNNPPADAYSDEYLKIHKEERYFTQYANTDIEESYCEHGGYISSMLANPEEQSKKITIEYFDKENKRFSTKDITFEEYKKEYPKNYKFFKNRIERGY